MHDGWKIVAGLAVFVLLVTSPLVYNAVSADPADVPELVDPPNGSRQCVEDAAWMRASHMDLLNDWRDAVVREGRRDYTSGLTGTVHDMSLSKTCTGCHSNKDEFCDRCHTYMAVAPYCWDCHVEPEEVS
jgi:hypothetical protein